jgi:hypothetical protein
MDALFCPQAKEWGDWATWVSGVGTLVVSGIALWLSRGSEIRERRLLESAQAARRDKAIRLAAAFDQELFMLEHSSHQLGSRATGFIRDRDSHGFPIDHIEEKRELLYRFAEGVREKFQLPLMTQLVEHFDAFDRGIDRHLTTVLSMCIQLRTSMRVRPEFNRAADEIDHYTVVGHLRASTRVLFLQAREARVALRSNAEISAIFPSGSLRQPPDWIVNYDLEEEAMNRDDSELDDGLSEQTS